ncbi:hypothetical protein [Anaerospora hongkongensis]|uniref:hypothetical protein n=1 Tax=Anaerospora hongkongensis TaxID=244830 RepID=UPI00289DD17E|nr:hypothetical protein [Anaerospora hongkongensis]
MLKMRLLGVVIFILVFSFLLSGCGKSEEDYKKTAAPVNQEEFTRNPDNLKGKPIMFTGVVQNVKENGKDVDLLFSFGPTPILAHYKLKDGEERIVSQDQVRVWGEFQKVSSKKLHELTPETSVIEIEAKYISRPKWTLLSKKYGLWTVKEDGNADPMDTKSLQVGMSVKKINNENVEIRGSMQRSSIYFSFTGKLDDNGIGEFEYIDKANAPTGIKGKIKIKNQDELEIETASIEGQREVFSKTYKESIDAGTYVFKRK